MKTTINSAAVRRELANMQTEVQLTETQVNQRVQKVIVISVIFTVASVITFFCCLFGVSLY